MTLKEKYNALASKFYENTAEEERKLFLSYSQSGVFALAASYKATAFLLEAFLEELNPDNSDFGSKFTEEDIDILLELNHPHKDLRTMCFGASYSPGFEYEIGSGSIDTDWHDNVLEILSNFLRPLRLKRQKSRPITKRVRFLVQGYYDVEVSLPRDSAAYNFIEEAECCLDAKDFPELEDVEFHLSHMSNVEGA